VTQAFVPGEIFVLDGIAQGDSIFVDGQSTTTMATAFATTGLLTALRIWSGVPVREVHACIAQVITDAGQTEPSVKVVAARHGHVTLAMSEIPVSAEESRLQRRLLVPFSVRRE
jgi:hypothetical protein